VQLLLANNLLLIYNNGHGSIMIYLEPIQTMGLAIQRGASKKALREDKLGGAALFAYDESKRMLAVCVKLQVRIFGDLKQL
jgi:hypothetical protein